jgi:serine/threonine-protein kinase
MTLTIGSTLEKRYRIEKKLGQGGFGAVYQAVDSRLNVHCAVKENLQMTSKLQKRFKREAVIISRPRLPKFETR